MKIIFFKANFNRQEKVSRCYEVYVSAREKGKSIFFTVERIEGLNVHLTIPNGAVGTTFKLP